jgi:hypothetical protein
VRRAVIVALIAMLAPMSARASVPPATGRPPSFQGPGILCGSGFNFALGADEVATAGFPSEGYDPTYVRSHGGNFAITAYAFNQPEIEKEKLSVISGGTVYLVKKVIREAAAGVPKTRSYWFKPTLGAPFSVDFFAAVPGQGGWGDFPTAEYESVIKRVSFAQPAQRGACLSPKPQG